MFGDDKYEEGKYPEELRLSPRAQVMDKYPRYSPDDGSLPKCLCCKVCAYGCCGNETKGFGPASCVFGCVLSVFKLYLAGSGMHSKGTFNRTMLQRVHAYSKSSAFKSVRVEDFEIPSREEGRMIPARFCCRHAASGDQPKPVMLYIQGGGFCQGNNRDSATTRMMSMFAKELDVICIGINYRLAPENPFPAGLHDVYDLLKWIATGANAPGSPLSTLSLALDKVVLFGESAGANLVLVACTLWRDGINADLEQTKDLENLTIRAQIIDYPTLFLPYPTPSSYTHGRNLVIPFYAMRWYRNSYLPEEKRADLFKDRRVCPLRAGLDKLPDTLHMYVGYDPLVDENHRLAELLEASTTNAVSKFYPQHVHGVFAMLQGKDEDVSQYAKALNFLRPILENS